MSRSIGDYKAHSVGVIAEPVVTDYILQADDSIIVIGSDGVFEFVSNEEVATIVHEYYQEGHAEKAANAVVRKAYQEWKRREDVVDDITCVVIFLHKDT